MQCAQQVFPGFDERFGPFILELSGQGIDVNAGFFRTERGHPRNLHLPRKNVVDLAMRAKALNVTSGMVFNVNGAARCLDAETIEGGGDQDVSDQPSWTVFRILQRLHFSQAALVPLAPLK